MAIELRPSSAELYPSLDLMFKVGTLDGQRHLGNDFAVFKPGFADMFFNRLLGCDAHLLEELAHGHVECIVRHLVFPIWSVSGEPLVENLNQIFVDLIQ